MKKIILFFMINICIVCFTACDMYSGMRPTDQKNSNWVSENPNIFFHVKDDESNDNRITEGALIFDDKIFSIDLIFDYVTSIYIIDYAKDMESKYTLSEVSLISGGCTFSEKKFTITVSETQIDGIKEGDKITFNRVDKLPEWATQTLGDSSS